MVSSQGAKRITCPAPSSVLASPVWRDNLDENGSGNQSLKWRPVAKVLIRLSRAVRKHFF
jgi:hypothetical protein